MAPLRQRFPVILGVMVGAPVCAEYLQAYLPDTGNALMMVGGLLVLGPLYGGAALLIREVAIRTGRGWTGILVMAAAFGLTMPSQIDGSMWLAHDPAIAYWDELRAGTLLEPQGFAVFPVLSWVTGHVLFSIGAPLILLDALAPRLRGRPLLGPSGLALVGGLCLIAALLIANDPDFVASDPSRTQAGLSLLAVFGLLGVAFSPVGRPRSRSLSVRTTRTPARTCVTAAIALLALDMLPPTRIGVGGYLAVLGVAGWWVMRAARSPAWGPAHVAALGVAAVLERTLAGFLSPLPPGVDAGEKLLQSALLLALVLATSLAAWRSAAAAGGRSRPPFAVGREENPNGEPLAAVAAGREVSR